MIKKAYSIKIREHPLEQFPEKFMEIQEAYKTLSDQQKRKLYDAEITYGKELKLYFHNYSLAMDDEDYEDAVRFLKKILVITPQDDDVLNKLSVVYTYQNKDEFAIECLQKATNINSQNPLYYMNLGYVYQKREQYLKAIRYYKQASILDPNDFEIARKISSIYQRIGDFESAWNWIEKSMKRGQIPPNLKILYMARLIELSVLENREFELKISKKYCEKFVKENPDYTEDCVNGLMNIIFSFNENYLYKCSYKLIDWIPKIGSKNQYLDKVLEDIRKKHFLYEQLDILLEDGRLLNSFKFKTYNYFYADLYDGIDEKNKDGNEWLLEECIHESYAMNKTITIVKREYKLVAQELNEIIENIQKII